MNQIQPHFETDPDFEVEFHSAQAAYGMVQPADGKTANLDFIGRERDINDFKRAAKHSTWVGLLKYLLPVIALIIVVSIIAALILRQKAPVGISIGSTGIEDGKLVMNNPKLDGLDPQNRPYKVEAIRAIQSIENPTLVNLELIQAKIPMEDGLWANIRAGNGSFDVTEKKLELGGGVNVMTSDGMKLTLKDAYVDLKAGTMNTYRAIKFTSDSATISSQSLGVFERGERIVFETDVELIIQPPAKATKKK